MRCEIQLAHDTGADHGIGPFAQRRRIRAPLDDRHGPPGRRQRSSRDQAFDARADDDGIQAVNRHAELGSCGTLGVKGHGGATYGTQSKSQPALAAKTWSPMLNSTGPG